MQSLTPRAIEKIFQEKPTGVTPERGSQEEYLPTQSSPGPRLTVEEQDDQIL